MKRCDTCRRVYENVALNFCRDDGAPLARHTAVLAEGAATRPLVAARDAAEELSGATPEARPCAPAITVLLFVDANTDAGNESFCDCLAEELVSVLTRVGAREGRDANHRLLLQGRRHARAGGCGGARA